MIDEAATVPSPTAEPSADPGPDFMEGGAAVMPPPSSSPSPASADAARSDAARSDAARSEAAVLPGEPVPTVDDAPAGEAIEPSLDRDEVFEAFGILGRRVDDGFIRLERAFENKLAYDEHKNRQIDTLHGELQQYKRDLLNRATRPLLTGIIRLHDNLGRQAEAWRDIDPSFERGADVLEEFQEDIEIVLEENGVDLFREPGDRFDPRRQTAHRTLDTTDAEKIGRIVRRLRPGFEQDGRLVQKERVEVWSMAEGATPSAATESTTDSPEPVS